jgi:hypothetical protein
LNNVWLDEKHVLPCIKKANAGIVWAGNTPAIEKKATKAACDGWHCDAVFASSSTSTLKTLFLATPTKVV